MELVRSLSLDEHLALKIMAQDHHQADILMLALIKPFAYKVHVTEDDFAFILMNSSPDDPQPSETRYFSLKDTIEGIHTDRSFLDTSIPNGLKGQHIAGLLAGFQSGNMSITDRNIFVVDYAPARSGPGPGPYVLDGMHTLVAYGLWDSRTFPIPAYYFSDTKASNNLIDG